MVGQRWLLGAALIAGVIGPVIATPVGAARVAPAAGSSGVSGSGPAFQYGVTPPPQQVQTPALAPAVQAPPRRPPTEAPYLRPPGDAAAKAQSASVPLSPEKVVAPQFASPAGSSGTSSGAPSGAAPLTAPASPGASHLLEQLDYEGMGFDQSSFAPPDTQVATGLHKVVETVNDEMSVYNKGGLLLKTTDLNQFFGASGTFSASDAEVRYDEATGRFYMVNVVFDTSTGTVGGSRVNLAVSDGTDPTGGWCIYNGVISDGAGIVADQPKLGFSNGLILITDNQNGNTPEDELVIQKSDADSCTSLHKAFRQASRFNLMPATSLTSTTTLYAGYNFVQSGLLTGSQEAGVVAYSGSPSAGNVVASETDVPIAKLHAPPNARQPGGAKIDTSDNRYQTAVFENGRFWLAGNDGCNPGDGNHSCLRFDEFDVSNGSQVLQDLDVSAPGSDAYYPALSFDRSGNIIFTYTESSTTQLPEAVVGGSPLPLTNTFTAIVTAQGDTAYSCTFCNGRPRWGDFSGAGQDPTSNSVWVAAEWGAQSSQQAGSDGWATQLTAVTFDRPASVRTSPTTGGSAGGTVVNVSGHNFVRGGTAVHFGSAASPHVIFVNTEQVRAVSPPHQPGSVSVSASDANGTGPTGSSSAFTYDPVVTSIAPSEGSSLGGTNVTIKGVGFTGATAVKFGGVGAAFSVTSDASITAHAPAESPGTVNVSITSNGETNPPSPSDRFTYRSPPSVSSVMPNSGPSGGGQTVTIVGTGLDGVSAVRFGTTAAAHFAVLSDSRITAKTPAHSPWTVHVRVVTPGGISAAAPSNRYQFLR